MSDSIECWHFAAKDRKLGYDDRRLIEAGAVHEVSVTPKCCMAGLHGSIRAIDALQYAPGSVISRVLISGAIHKQDDKLCGKRREYLAVADAEEELRSFVRWCALSVSHLWDMPEIVRKYLDTGDESLRMTAWTAARDVASSAARAAEAASMAAEAASMAVARDVAIYAARAVEWDAAIYAAREAAAAAASAAARAARDARDAELDRRLRKILNLEPA